MRAVVHDINAAFIYISLMRSRFSIFKWIVMFSSKTVFSKLKCNILSSTCNSLGCVEYCVLFILVQKTVN